MTYATTVRSPSAILVGVLFTAVTAWVLLDDVLRHGAPWTTKHLMTLAVLAGTVYFGHAFWAELRSCRLGNMAGCAILFLAGTATCVLMSAGRNAEVVTNKVLVANSGNAHRERALNDRTEAKARYQAALAAETSECATGRGVKCDSKRITTTLRRDDLNTAEAAVRALPPEQIANADIRAAAELVVKLPGVTATVEAVEAMLQLAFPFLQSLFCEIAAVVGFSMGLGHQKRQLQAQLPAPIQLQSVAPTVTTVAETVDPAVEDDWVPVSVTEARELARRARAEALFDALRRQSPLSNDELADRLEISKGECSRRVSALENADLVRRQRAGRYVAITLRPLTA